jgi:hypothetical protein
VLRGWAGSALRLGRLVGPRGEKGSMGGWGRKEKEKLFTFYIKGFNSYKFK